VKTALFAAGSAQQLNAPLVWRRHCLLTQTVNSHCERMMSVGNSVTVLKRNSVTSLHVIARCPLPAQAMVAFHRCGP